MARSRTMITGGGGSPIIQIGISVLLLDIMMTVRSGVTMVVVVNIWFSAREIAINGMNLLACQIKDQT